MGNRKRDTCNTHSESILNTECSRLSQVPLLSFNWPIRSLPRELTVQQCNFLGPSMTSELFPPLLLNQHLGPLDTITELPFKPPSPLILCTNTFNNLTISHLDFYIPLMTHCSPDSFPSVYRKKSEPSFQIQTGQAVPLSRINTKFFSCRS